MAVTRRVGVAGDPRFERHRGPAGHPERPERLAAVARAVEERADRLVRIEPRPAEDAEILRVHGAEHLAFLEQAARRAPLRLDPDTYLGRESAEIARIQREDWLAYAWIAPIDLLCVVYRSGESRLAFGPLHRLAARVRLRIVTHHPSPLARCLPAPVLSSC